MMARLALVFGLMFAAVAFGCSRQPPDPATVFERYVLDPRPDSIVVLDQYEFNDGGAFEDVAAVVRFKVAPEDFQDIVDAHGLAIADERLSKVLADKNPVFPWWNPEELGYGRELWYIENGEHWMIYVNSGHDEVLFWYSGL